jgi:hypothetical protein
MGEGLNLSESLSANDEDKLMPHMSVEPSLFLNVAVFSDCKQYTAFFQDK